MHKDLPSFEDLNNKFRYNKNTGKLYLQNTHHEAGNGTITYPKVWMNGDAFYKHRVCYFLGTGIDPKENLVDHKNGDPRDNRLSNLRLVNMSQNKLNGKACGNKRNLCGCLGVSQTKKGFMATICINGKQHYLGLYQDLESAKNARIKAEKKLIPNIRKNKST